MEYFDHLFRCYTELGYTIEEFLDSQAFIITPRNMGFAEAKPETLKRLVDALWNPEFPSEIPIGLVKAAGKIEKYSFFRFLRKDERRN